jgi:hypothetical protein
MTKREFIVRSKIKDLIKAYEASQEDKKIELRMYKVRWIWYHTVLAIELFFVVLLLIAIFIKI